MPIDDIHAGPLHRPFEEACARLEARGFLDALWKKRLDLWTEDPAVQRKIGDRLGWTDAVETIAPHLDRLRTFAASVARDGFTDVVLLGMGGSSLAPEVLRQVIGTSPDRPRLTVLDSVDPDAVRDAFARAETSLFLFASKSGTTIEPNVLAAEARRRVEAAGHAWGSRFVAITDPDTALHRLAVAERFRDCFVNPPDIGGRYSALSFFGMVPAAIIGADLDALLAHARRMESACRRESVAENPGLALGALMAAGVQAGRDKLTLLLPERLQPFGLWIEQLVAESTGKQGTGVVPITGEPAGVPFGTDRLAVAMTIGDAAPETDRMDNARAAGLPLAALHLPDAAALGAEFLRWEVATAAAGFLLGINPFDEPNVQQAKDATRALLDAYRADRHLPLPQPDAVIAGARVTLSRATREQLAGRPTFVLSAQLRGGDYAGFLVYLPPDDPAPRRTLDALRLAVSRESGCATTLGYGPRYLHSTGQLHKGGADNGVFVIITADPAEDLAVPGEPFSFGVLEMAQALGDFQSLDRAGRRALYVHLPRRDPAGLEALAAALARFPS